MDVSTNNDLQKKLEILMKQKRLASTDSIEKEELKPASRRKIKLPLQKENDKNSVSQEAKTEVSLIQSKDLEKGAQRPPKRAAKFEETHKRFTNYLEIELLDAIQRLNKNGEIQSITAIVNDAIYEYVHNYFPNELKK